jgi:hypothetical protein
MNAAAVQSAIFVPVLVVVALTIIAFLRMAFTRYLAAKAGVPAAFYRTYQGTPGEPEFAVVAARHYGNLFEGPVLFYVGCLVAFDLSAVSHVMLIWAWGYVILRVIQSLIHLTYNNPLHRGPAFTLSFLFLIAMWVNIAIDLFARV